MSTREGRISDLEDRVIEIIHTKTIEEKKIEKQDQHLNDLGHKIKLPNVWVIADPKIEKNEAEKNIQR